QLERRAGVVVPELVGVDRVPVRALARFEQEVDRRRGAARLLGRAEGLAIVAAPGMRLQPEEGDHLVRRLHAASITPPAARSPWSTAASRSARTTWRAWGACRASPCRRSAGRDNPAR